MGPLHGVKVVEIAGIGPGPFCGMLLADMGAQVIRVARDGASDPAVEIPARFDLMNRSRPTITADLKSSRGVELVLRLCEDADAIFEGFRPGVMEKLGLEEGQVLEHPWLNKSIERAQRRVEQHNFSIRKRTLEYDDVMNQQRKTIYALRKQVLEGKNMGFFAKLPMKNLMASLPMLAPKPGLDPYTTMQIVNTRAEWAIDEKRDVIASKDGFA